MIVITGIIAVFFGFLAFIAISYLRSYIKKRNRLNIEEFLKRGNYTRVIEILRETLSKNHFDYNAHFLLADAYMGIGNTKLAILEYRLAMRGIDKELLSYEVSLRKKLSKALMQNGNDKEALEELLLLSKIENQDSKVFYKIAKVYEKFGNMDKAINYIKMAIKYKRENFTYYYYLGLIYYRMQRYRDATKEFLECISRNKTHGGANYYIGASYQEVGDYHEALNYLHIAERENEFRLRALLHQGICYMQIGNFLEAEERLVKVTQSKQIDGSRVKLYGHYYLSKLYEDKSDVIKAIEHWEAIAKVDAEFKDVPLKLRKYSDLRKSDLVKDYMTCSVKEFYENSQELLKIMQLVVHEEKNVQADEELHFICREEVKMMLMTKVVLKYVIFNRSSHIINDDEIRKSLEAAKWLRCSELIYVTISGATPSCKQYIQNRPIKLIYGTALNDLLGQL